MDVIPQRMSLQDLHFSPTNSSEDPVLTTISLRAPYSALRRYFGIQTTWYLQSHTECAKVLKYRSI